MVYGREISWGTMSLKIHLTQIEAIAQPAVDVIKPSNANSMHDKSAC